MKNIFFKPVCIHFCLFCMVTSIFLMTGCSSDTEEEKETAKFAGMANTETSTTLEDEEYNILIDNDDYPFTITDYLGKEVTLETKPETFAVLSGTYLTLWYELGGTSICKTDLGSCYIPEIYFEKINALPSVGAVYNANVEAIIEQNPEFIIAQAGTQSSISTTLSGMGYKIVTLHMRSYQDVLEHMRVFGVILGQQAKIDEMITSMEQRKQEIVDQLPEQPKTAVILYVTSSSLSVKLNNSIAGDIANILGLVNIAADLPPDTLGSESTPLDIEYIVEKNPDVILVTSMISSNEEAIRVMEEEFSTNPAWAGIEAIKENRVVYLPQEYFLYCAAHNYVDAIDLMAKGVYPEIFDN